MTSFNLCQNAWIGIGLQLSIDTAQSIRFLWWINRVERVELLRCLDRPPHQTAGDACHWSYVSREYSCTTKWMNTVTTSSQTTRIAHCRVFMGNRWTSDALFRAMRFIFQVRVIYIYIYILLMLMPCGVVSSRALDGPKCIGPARTVLCTAWPGPARLFFYVKQPDPARCSLSDRGPARPVHTFID